MADRGTQVIGDDAKTGTSHRSRRRRRRDRGFSLAETVISIALTGVAVTAVVASVNVTLTASATDSQHANGFAWLQAASDAIHLTDRVACTDDGQGRLDAIAAYDAAAQTATRPNGWDSASISVSDVEYLGRLGPDDEFSWSQNFCFEGDGYADSPLFTQRVTLDVVFPNGTSTQTMQMVKSER